MPTGCHIIHVETIQRHGDRHMNKIEKLDEAIQYFENLSKWFLVRSEK